MNRVEFFSVEGSAYDLEHEINRYCREYDYKPISVSVTQIGDSLLAAVVVEVEQ